MSEGDDDGPRMRATQKVAVFKDESWEGGPDDTQSVTGSVVVATLPKDRCVLTVLAGPGTGAVLTLEKDSVVIGRGHESDIRLDDAGMSRKHARFVRRGGLTYVEDLKSHNGTLVQGLRIRKQHALRDGDRLQLGGTLLRVSWQDALEEQVAVMVYESSVRDPLTGIYNRRHFIDRLEAEFAFANRHESGLSVLMMDLDHFKQVNDAHGHMAGDAILGQLARFLQRVVRTEDIVARYGGEEFVVLLRGIDAMGAKVLAERIRQAVQSLPCPVAGAELVVTLSIGIATLDESNEFESARALLSAADDALYRAKEGGRNRVSQHGR